MVICHNMNALLNRTLCFLNAKEHPLCSLNGTMSKICCTVEYSECHTASTQIVIQ